jgi:transcriptional regulator with XRE-family HTH domain
MKHQFSSRLRKLRHECGLLQRDVEEVLCLGMGALSQYERGLREPGFDLLVTFADFFDVSIDYLLGRSDAPESSPALRAARVGLQERGMVDQPLQELVQTAVREWPGVFGFPKLARNARVSPEMLQRMLTGELPMAAEVGARLAAHLGFPLPHAIIRSNSPRTRCYPNGFIP